VAANYPMLSVLRDSSLDKEPRLKKAWDYLEKNPPEKQVVIGGILDFQSDEQLGEMSPLQRATKAVKTVRNNHFHGGKFLASRGYEIQEEPGRKPQLLKDCTILLHEMLELAPDVKAAFRSLVFPSS
jgi:hypothetical protein